MSFKDVRVYSVHHWVEAPLKFMAFEETEVVFLWLEETCGAVNERWGFWGF